MDEHGAGDVLRGLGRFIAGAAGRVLPRGSSANSATEQFIDAFLADVNRGTDWHPKATQHESGRKVLKLAPDQQVRVVRAAVDRLVEAHGPSWIAGELRERNGVKALLSALLRKPLPYTDEDVVAILAGTAGAGLALAYFLPCAGILNAVRRRYDGASVPPVVIEALQQLRRMFERHKSYAAFRALVADIDEMLHGPAELPPLKIESGEAWSDAALEDLSSMSAAERAGWSSLLAHTRTADGARPTKKWLARSGELVTALGVEPFEKRVTRWLSLVEKPRTQRINHQPQQWVADPNQLIATEHADLLKGLAWSCAASTSPALARALADAVMASFKKIPNHGPRCAKLGSACLFALSAMPIEEAAAQLGRLEAQLKQPTGKKNAAKALSQVAQRTGQTPEDLVELAVPTFGLDAEGVSRNKLGSSTAELRITGGSCVKIEWVREDGSVQKSIPTEVRADHTTELKSLHKTAKDIDRMLPAQRDRIERLMTSGREWSLDNWRQRYLSHPLLGTLARRLIWTITDGQSATTVGWLSGQLVTFSDARVEIHDQANARVRLWHPIDSDVTIITAWRDWLQRHEVVQPFKQAYREIYILTDAERATRTYSNRFAGHIVRQHQFVALCQQRGWKTKLQGSWDGGDSTPTLVLPRWNLRAQFWSDMSGEGNELGVANFLATDQVRFYPEGDPHADALPLEQVPPLPFSEVMRDVDLFVGVASVGNDPAWQDGGPHGRYQGYWHTFSFGDLSESAKTRRAVLERLVPRLKIASRCSLADRFLIVRGDVRTYKIHLGSGNILMEPNDQYLCIVPGRRSSSDSGSNNVFLPFEGDATLSVIISKALLLAADSKIKDDTITRQIKMR